MISPLMVYLPPVSQPQEAPVHGANKYYGPIASGYDAKREKDEKWVVEQRIITDMLSDLPPETIVLDCPVGTGRFLEFYLEKGFKFIGMDLSGDMLIQSALKLGAQPEDLQKWVALCKERGGVIPIRIDGDKGQLGQGDVRSTGLPDKSVDVCVNCRISRWLSPDDNQVMFREMQRVARKTIIWTARVANHPHARTRALYEAALQPGWSITADVAGYITDYRILRAECAA
jgi:ubiquinone/menaquinone biosynthesis C-methylase UbiE